MTRLRTRPRRRALRAALAGLGAVVTALTLVACVPLPRTSTPTYEQVPAQLERFYHQVLEWHECGRGIQCATAIAPMDWNDPEGETIELALSRQPTLSSSRLGSLLVNPGGPGSSGRDLVLNSVDFATSSRLQNRFDIVGFDPRGVGASSAVSCHDDPAELDAFLYDRATAEFGSDAWLTEQRATAARFAEACLEHTGPLLGHIDTNSAARDMDLLRAVLGDERLNYLGFSYGSLLGATYAELYPEGTGRLVLDGALDPATSEFEVTATQAQGFESAMRSYLADCLARTGCAFDGRPDDAGVEHAMQSIGQLLDRLEASPLRNSDGRQLGASTMFTAIILPLYNEQTWDRLDQLFDDVLAGRAGVAFGLADAYNDRASNGEYLSNLTEAFLSINCLDYASDTSTSALRADAAALSELAPVFGKWMSYGLACDSWPFPATRDRVPITAAGSADILVVGTTNDPATPYVWAQNLAAQLENGHLVTYRGEGHTAYNTSNACINITVDRFFIDGEVPETDPNC